MDKSSFILYTDYYEQIELLTIEQRGVLLTACMLYQLGRELPEMDPITKMAYMFISADIRRNNEKYETIVERRREAGSKGGKQTQANRANATFATFASNSENKQNQAKQANQAKASDNDNENVNDNGNGNVDVPEKENEKDDGTITPSVPLKGEARGKFQKPTLSEIREYCIERGNSVSPEEFFDFYESKGWMIGKSPMKDWRACIRTWERNQRNQSGSNRYADIDDWLRRRTQDDEGGVFDNS